MGKIALHGVVAPCYQASGVDSKVSNSTQSEPLDHGIIDIIIIP